MNDENNQWDNHYSDSDSFIDSNIESNNAPTTSSGGLPSVFDLIQSKPQETNNQFGSTDSFNSFDNGMYNSFGYGNIPQQNFNQQQTGNNRQQQIEDALFDGAVKGSKALYTGSKSLTMYLKSIFFSYTIKEVYRLGDKMFKYGGVLAMLSFVTMMVLKIDNRSILLASGLISSVGVATLFLSRDKAHEYERNEQIRKQEELNSQQAQMSMEQEQYNHNLDSISESLFDNEQDSDYDMENDEDFNPYEEEYEDSYDEYDEEPKEDAFSVLERSQSEVAPEDVDANIEQISSLPQELVSRQLLFDSYMGVLKNWTPDFSDKRELDYEDVDDSEEWEYYQGIIRKSQSQIGLKLYSYDDEEVDTGDRYSEVLSIVKGLITIEIICSRPTAIKGGKKDEFDRELTSILQGAGINKDTSKYAISEVSGDRIYITIFTGNKPVVSLKDGMMAERDFFLDPDNLMPVVFGYDEYGRVLKEDFSKLNGVLVAGLKRSGKTVFLKGLVSQIIQFSSPKQATFYIADVKGRSSEWGEFKTPHIKEFEYEASKIVKMIERLVTDEAKRRIDLLADSGYNDVRAYNQANPDNPIPYAFILIDEVIALNNELMNIDKELQKTYTRYLMEIATKFPYIAIFALIVPHEVKDQYISKGVSNQMDNRFIFRGSAEEIQNATETKPSDFKYVLSSAGDCAVKLASSNSKVAQYMRAFLLGVGTRKVDIDTNTSEVLEYQNKLWDKLSDDEDIKSSYQYKKERRESAYSAMKSRGIID